MNIKEFFKKNSDEFLEFDEVENKLSNRPDLCAFILLDKLLPGDSDIVSAAEHDEIFLDVDIETLESVATADDLLTLIRCGVRYDSDFDCLAMFV